MAGSLYYEISFNHTYCGHFIHDKLIKSIICVLLSNVSPIIMFCLRKYHYHPKLRSLLKWMNITHLKPPTWDSLYELENSMNLYRWKELQFYRHEAIFCQAIFPFFVSLTQCILVSVTYKDQTQKMLLISTLFIIVTIIRIMHYIVVDACNILFVQSYWDRVLYGWLDLLYFVLSSMFLTLILPHFLKHIDDPEQDNTIHAFSLAMLILLNLLFWWLISYQIRKNGIIWTLFKNRVKAYDESDFVFWSNMRFFIENAIDKEDEIRQLCCIKHELVNFYVKCKNHKSGDCLCYQDKKLVPWLQINRQSLFRDVKEYSQIRANSSDDSVLSNPVSQLVFPFLRQFCLFWEKQLDKARGYLDYMSLQHEVGLGIAILLLGPLYSLFRFTQFLLPLHCIGLSYLLESEY